MKIPVKTIISIGATVAMSAATTIMQQVQQKKMIEEVGAKVGQEIVKNVNKG